MIDFINCLCLIPVELQQAENTESVVSAIPSGYLNVLFLPPCIVLSSSKKKIISMTYTFN